MLRSSASARLLSAKRSAVSNTRSSSSLTSGSSVRRAFLDFYSSSHRHRVVPSASVAPHADPSLAFTNAGMNQFKSCILHPEAAPAPPAPRVANSQKCIRLGGRHNDLEAVGHDGSHHTFFEMLGTWSFGDYFKEKACAMSWELVTDVYRLDRDRIFVTYFGGCPELGLGADEETREAWRRLGVEEDRILPFSAKDNFWEMAASGPCGPCTEIHFDHLGGAAADRAPLVNAGREDLVELGNLVFMQHRRAEPGGPLEPLSRPVVDTGFGLERLTAVQLGSRSNYDSDLFSPLFDCATSFSGAPAYGGRFAGPDHIDTQHRILADHARMVAACLGDGMFPDSSPRLRGVIRRALAVSSDVFGCDHRLLVELVRRAADVLGEQYPEMSESGDRAAILLEFEAASARQAEEDGRAVMPRLVSEYPKASGVVEERDAVKVFEALKRATKLRTKTGGEWKVLRGDKALDLYRHFGLSKDNLRTLAEVMGVAFDEEGFDSHLQALKNKSKLDTASALPKVRKLPRTDASAVHGYTSSEPLRYRFPSLQAKVLAIGSEGDLVQELAAGQEGAVYLDKTAFYAEAGGQAGDVGKLVIKARKHGGSKGAAVFEVADCQRVLGSTEHVAHLGKLKGGGVGDAVLRVGDTVAVQIDVRHRLGCMQNHTATHMVNEALRDALPLTCQKSSHVGPDSLRLDFR